jgi:Spirocyclase AveC-like
VIYDLAQPTTATNSTERHAPRSSGPSRGAVAWFLMLAGALLLAWQAVTMLRWVSRGNAESITNFRDPSALSAVGARVFEFGFLASTTVLVAIVARHAWRERRFTLDAMILLGLLSSAWLDPAFAFYKQIFLYSSQFANVSAWCGDMPWLLNPQCGQMPEPLVVPLMYVNTLMGAMFICWVIGRIRPRLSQWTVWHTLLSTAVIASALDLLWEVSAIKLDLWKYASFPDALAFPGLSGADRFPLTALFTCFVMTAAVVVLRTHRDGTAESFLQRGETGRIRSRLLTFVAVIGYIQVAVLVSFVPAMLSAPYAGPWAPYPAHIINDMCDNNARSTTPYPCH